MSQSKCPNCESVITCGCQRRKGVDGKDVCTRCINDYNKLISTLKQQEQQQIQQANINIEPHK